jgi:FkbM family methyltransferase
MRARLAGVPFSPASLVSLALFGIVLWFGLRGYLPRHPADAEYAWLQRTYGPDRNSESVEEWIIRDVFRDRRGGVFLDVGAAHYQEHNNTYFLETSLAWSGVAIDAIPSYAEGYRLRRPRTRFFSFFVSDRSDDVVEFYELRRNNAASSGDRRFVERYREQPVQRRVETITLNDLLGRIGIAHVDFVSVDVELAEPKAMAGFDIRRFAPALVCIEAHPEVRQALLDYFTRNGYVALGKYLRVDERNLYFAPLGARVEPFPADVMRAWTGHGR